MKTCMMLRAISMCRMALTHGCDFIYYLPCLGTLKSAPLPDEFLELARQKGVKTTAYNNACIILSTMNISIGTTPLPLLGPVLLRAILDHDCSGHSYVHRGITERQDLCVPHDPQGTSVRQDLCAPQAKDDSDADNDEFEVEPTVDSPILYDLNPWMSGLRRIKQPSEACGARSEPCHA